MAPLHISISSGSVLRGSGTDGGCSGDGGESGGIAGEFKGGAAVADGVLKSWGVSDSFVDAPATYGCLWWEMIALLLLVVGNLCHKIGKTYQFQEVIYNPFCCEWMTHMAIILSSYIIFLSRFMVEQHTKISSSKFTKQKKWPAQIKTRILTRFCSLMKPTQQRH